MTHRMQIRIAPLFYTNLRENSEKISLEGEIEHNEAATLAPH